MDITKAARIIEKRHPYAYKYVLTKYYNWNPSDDDADGIRAMVDLEYHGLRVWASATKFVAAATEASDKMDKLIEERKAKET